jgi:hypothetical protein
MVDTFCIVHENRTMKPAEIVLSRGDEGVKKYGRWD